ncbi:enoyl-CoA hydratase-related protein [Oceaniglobus ichthyenteri]|uniref:enoyl-CoA hydratase-related protein n=1 Tax=Oceaniglobus ichthyenteri TaxID=2136177 RepID=UPI000D392963|nr:enoyl-CoA hydratase-related protein [Oceaniglobus ichthyenteri]
MADVLVERPSDAIAIVRLNRPEVRNALNLSIRQELAEIFRTLADDTTLRCVVLTGDSKSFAAGADIADMARIDAIEMYHRHTERLWAAVGECPVPVIAAVNGFALGGGLELAMHADIIIAGKGAKLGQPEVKVGIMPGAGGTQRLTRAVGKFRAMCMCLTGEIITAPEAFEMGLISKLVEDDAVFDTALAMAEAIAKLPPIAVAQIKEVILAGADAPLSAALALERKAVQVLFASKDKAEGMAAFLEKRKPTFTGE